MERRWRSFGKIEMTGMRVEAHQQCAVDFNMYNR